MTEPHRLSDALNEPRNVAAEASLLGAMMIDNRIIDIAADIVKPDDFYEPLHAVIYETILNEAAAGRVVTPVTLKPYFESDRTMKELGGVAYLVRLTADSSALIGARDFARQLRDLSKLRTLAAVGRRLAEQACDTSEEINPISLVNELDNAFAAVLQQGSSTKSMSIAKAFDHTLSAIMEEANGDGSNAFEIPDFATYTKLFGRLRTGDVTILAGRPGMGKTATALRVATCAAKAGVATAFISLEMPLEGVVVRTMADWVAELPMAPTFEAIKDGNLTSQDMQLLRQTRAELESWPLIFTDPTGVTIGKLAMLIRRYKRRFAGDGRELKLVVVDYLQLIRGDRQNRNRYEEIGQISRSIKEIAKECGVHIIMLSQLSRAVEQRDDKRPQLHDLRDSGDIEQDADNVVFVYRHEYYLNKTAVKKGQNEWSDHQAELAESRNRLELLCRKHRQGVESIGHCFFYGSHMAIRDFETNIGGDSPWAN